MPSTGCGEFESAKRATLDHTVWISVGHVGPVQSLPFAVVDLTSTVVDSDVPATHPMTDSDGTGSVASSGFLNMFAWDLHTESVFTRIDTSEEDSGNDDESVASSRTGASEVHQHSVSEFEQEVEPEFPPVIQMGTQALR